MLGLVKKSKLENAQAQLANERINNSQLVDEVTTLRKENKTLRERNAVLFSRTPAARKRDTKGHFLPNK